MNWPTNPIADIVRGSAWPLQTIRVAKPDCDSTLMVWLTYASWVSTQHTDERLPGVTIQGGGSPADTYRAVLEMPSPQMVQDWISELGWRVGAGYLYRWHFAPGRPMRHLWGLDRYIVGDEESALGDSDPSLADLCKQYGCWQWEINCAWRRGEARGWQLERWRKHDPTLLEDGSRAGAWPGWDGEHPWLRATELGTAYESHYYYVRPERYCPTTDVLRRAEKPEDK